MWNAISLVQDLNLYHRVHFLWRKPLHHGHLHMVLWHINHYRFFYAISSLCIYMKYIWFINTLLYTSMRLQEKWDWQEDLVYFVYWINEINKQMKYQASDKQLLWSGWTVLSGNSLRTAGDLTACETSAWPIYMFPTSNTRSRKYYLWKKMIGWKIDQFFFITENFLGILNRLCTELMCRSHDFFSLTPAVIGSTSCSYFFLLQCRCLSVYVLCVLVVRCVKS